MIQEVNAKTLMHQTRDQNGKENGDEDTDTVGEGEDAVESEAEEATVQETSEGVTAYE